MVKRLPAKASSTLSAQKKTLCSAIVILAVSFRPRSNRVLLTKADQNASHMVIQLARNICVLWSSVSSSLSPSRPPRPPPVKGECGWGRLCGFLCEGDEQYTLCLAVGRDGGLTYIQLTGLLVPS